MTYLRLKMRKYKSPTATQWETLPNGLYVSSLFLPLFLLLSQVSQNLTLNDYNYIYLKKNRKALIFGTNF